jgi:hypothetical protein
LPIWAWKPVRIFDTVYFEWHVLHLITVKRSSFFINVSGERHVLQETYSSTEKKQLNDYLSKCKDLTDKWTKNIFDLSLS